MNSQCHEMFSNFKHQRSENYNLWLHFIQSDNDVSIFWINSPFLITSQETGEKSYIYIVFDIFFLTVGSCQFNLKLFSCRNTEFKWIFQVKWKEINELVIFHDVIMCADAGFWSCISLNLLHPLGLQSLKYLLSSPSLKKFADPLYIMTYDRIF